MSLSAMFIFSARNFIPDAYGAKSQHQKMNSIHGTGFWSMCHGYMECSTVFVTVLIVIVVL